MTATLRLEPNFLSYATADVVGFRRGKGSVTGDVGLEIEVEGSRLPGAIGSGAGWSVVRDGSLRGESFEYVFNGPKPRKVVNRLVNDLWDAFKANESVLNTSYRTSVHVHLNFSQKTMKDVFNMYCAYTLVEGLLMDFCGNGRKGNLFCLRPKDAKYLHAVLYKSLRCGRLLDINDNIRYSAINVNALLKYGSIEIRSMRGLTTPEPVKQWVQILLELYDYACSDITPREMVEAQSMWGPPFLDRIFSPESVTLLTGTLGPHEVVEKLFEGSRLIQDIAYDFDKDFQHARNYFRQSKDVEKKSKQIIEEYTAELLSRMGTGGTSASQIESPTAQVYRQMYSGTTQALRWDVVHPTVQVTPTNATGLPIEPSNIDEWAEPEYDGDDDSDNDEGGDTNEG